MTTKRKGKCPKSGCIKKVGDSYRVVSIDILQPVNGKDSWIQA